MHVATKAQGDRQGMREEKTHRSICSSNIRFISGTKCAGSPVIGRKGKENKQNLISIMQEYQRSCVRFTTAQTILKCSADISEYVWLDP